jgi:hypothetical protein
MQLLIDTATETPKSLLIASRILSQLSAELFIAEAGPQPSINGTGGEIKLHEHTHDTASGATVALNATFAVPDAPTAPDAAHAPHAPDPVVIFGRLGPKLPNGCPSFVPTGTNMDPPHAGGGTNSVASASSSSPASAPPAPMTTQPSALPATTAAAAGATLPGTTGAPIDVNHDKAGIPWDARVHSETRKLNADGTWRFRRNLDESVKTAVMAELKGSASFKPTAVQLPGGTANVTGVSGGLAAGPLPGQLPLPPEAPPVPGYVHAANTLPAAPDAPVILPGTLPLPPGAHVGLPDAPNPPVVSAPVTGFRDLMSKINIARAQGRLSQEQVDAACKAANVGSITELAAQPALVPSVNAQIDRFLGVAA